MIFPSNRLRIMVATKPIDFRKGHDSLAALVKNALHEDPFTGTVFVFRARKTDRLKLLYWDGTGLVMAYKRLEEHEFTWPAVKDGLMTLSHAQVGKRCAGHTLAAKFQGSSSLIRLCLWSATIARRVTASQA
jgi:transposase